MVVGYILYTSFDVSVSKARQLYLVDLQEKLISYDWRQTQTTGSPANRLWDSLQSRQKCCGILDRHDWTSSRPIELDERSFPESCCDSTLVDASSKELKHCSNSAPVFTSGCLGRINLLRRIVTLYYLCVAFLQIFLALIATNLNPTVESREARDDPTLIQMHSWRRGQNFRIASVFLP